MRKLITLLAGVFLLVSSPSSGAAPEQSAGIGDCLHITNHVYEACYAYVVNDSSLALRHYYQNAHSANSSKAGDALEDFHYRYRASARSLIESRVAGWPKGENVVAVPSIAIISAKSSLKTNTASLTTRETWRVTTTAGRVLYSEKNHLHHISMARVQGKLLHIWVVTEIR